MIDAARSAVLAPVDCRDRRVGEADCRRRIVASLDRIGFAGRIYSVNPGYPTVLGGACYASMAELPEVPDVAAFCLGSARVLGAFVAAAERGIKGAVTYDGGFAEQGGEARRLQSQIEGICRGADIPLCGPNCMGVPNPHHPSTIRRSTQPNWWALYRPVRPRRGAQPQAPLSAALPARGH